MRRKDTLGTGVSSWENLKSYTVFSTKYSSIKKIGFFVSTIIFIVGFICSRAPSVPPAVVGVFLGLFLISIFIDSIWLDQYDDRIYIADRDIIIKAKGITKKYHWTDIDYVAQRPNNEIMIEFIDQSNVVLKNVHNIEELIVALNHHINGANGE